jgi:hypothetical protein
MKNSSTTHFSPVNQLSKIQGEYVMQTLSNSGSVSIDPRIVHALKLVAILALVGTTLYVTTAYGQNNSGGINIEGATSKHAALKGFGDVGQTIIYVLTNWIGPVVGACLCLFGIFKLAVKEGVTGAIAVFGGGMLMGVSKACEWIKTLLA